MAKKFTTGIDLANNQARNFVIEIVNVSDIDNITPVKGKVVYNEENEMVYWSDGTQWYHIPRNKSDVDLSNVENVAQIPMSYLDTNGALTANSDQKVASQKATKTYVESRVSYLQGLINGTMEYIGMFDGTKTIAQNGITTINKGQFWSVGTAGTASGINSPGGLQIGDMLIANATKSSAITASDFDYIANAIPSDVVRTDAEQTIVEKYINAQDNYISNIGLEHLLDGLVVEDDLQAAGNDHIPTAQAVVDYVDYVVGYKTSRYIGTITNQSYGTIAASTHGCGSTIVVQIYELVGGVRTMIECDIALDSAGTVTWSASTAINGVIIIIG